MQGKYNAKEWEQLLLDFKGSDMTTKAWCESKGITKVALYYWMKKLNFTKEKVKWAKIPIKDSETTISSSFITIKVANFLLEIKSGFNKSELKDILNVVKQLC